MMCQGYAQLRPVTRTHHFSLAPTLSVQLTLGTLPTWTTALAIETWFPNPSSVRACRPHTP